jgi:hypothetical protein
MGRHVGVERAKYSLATARHQVKPYAESGVRSLDGDLKINPNRLVAEKHGGLSVTAVGEDMNSMQPDLVVAKANRVGPDRLFCALGAA